MRVLDDLVPDSQPKQRALPLPIRLLDDPPLILHPAHKHIAIALDPIIKHPFPLDPLGFRLVDVHDPASAALRAELCRREGMDRPGELFDESLQAVHFEGRPEDEEEVRAFRQIVCLESAYRVSVRVVLRTKGET